MNERQVVSREYVFNFSSLNILISQYSVCASQVLAGTVSNMNIHL